MKKTLLIAALFATARLFGQAIPDGDFESWNSTPYSEANNWFSSNPQSIQMLDSVNVTKITGYSGNAIHMHTIIKGTDTDFAYITNTPGDPTKAKGGIPYSQMSTGLSGWYRYNLPGNDTAIIFVIFKKNGSVIGMYTDKIRGTGSQPAWTSFTFTFIPALATTPDTVIMAAASSNAIDDKGIQNGSWLDLDQLVFTGPSSAIPNGTFDTWTAYSFDIPIKWTEQFAGNGLPGVTKNTGYAGLYCVSLQTLGGGGGPSQSAISTGKITNSGPVGGEPYTLTKDTLTGYYEYTTTGNDSGQVGVTLTKNSSIVGGIYTNLKPAATWTYFSIPFSAFTTPDTIRIDLISSLWNNNATVGSTFQVDNLSLKSEPLGITNFNPTVSANKTYPNPAKDELNIQLGSKVNGNVHVAIYDMTGRIVQENDMTANNNLVHLNISGLYPGVYFYKLSTPNSTFQNRFVKE